MVNQPQSPSGLSQALVSLHDSVLQMREWTFTLQSIAQKTAVISTALYCATADGNLIKLSESHTTADSPHRVSELDDKIDSTIPARLQEQSYIVDVTGSKLLVSDTGGKRRNGQRRDRRAGKP